MKKSVGIIFGLMLLFGIMVVSSQEPPTLIIPGDVGLPGGDEVVTLIEFCNEDTDEGNNPFVAGTAKFEDDSGFLIGGDVEHSDYCIDSSKVMEYYCSEGLMKNESFVCEDGCAGNRCKNIIMKLSYLGNAHGEIHSGNYLTEISYDEIFNHPYVRANAHEEKTLDGKNNLILSLSADTNAHAQVPELGTYPTNIYYGNLDCRSTTTNCDLGEECVVTLSEDTNAHVAKCNVVGSYTNKICCKELCQSFDTRNGCWNSSNQCTWSPITNSVGILTDTEADGGHCCEADEEWVSGQGCQSSIACDIPLTLTAVNFLKANNIPGAVDTLSDKGLTNFDDFFNEDGPLDKDNDRYCAQAMSGIDYGIWENAVPYTA